MEIEKKPEIVAPASNLATLNAAIKAGADAIYLGIHGLNMRATTENFSIKDLRKIVNHCHKKNVKVYLSLNTIVFDSMLNYLEKTIREAKKSCIDAAICFDLAAIQLAKKYELPIHLSTQASVANSLSAKFFKDLGIKRIVLARECNLEQIKKIKENTGIEIEAFVHGSLCIAISGRCFLSSFLHGKSANLGLCLQNCRREYKIIDDEGNELKLGNHYILSSKDLCCLPFIEKLINAGIDAFKIEGRKKKADYVYVTVKAYRDILDFYFNNKDKENFEESFKKKKEELMKELEKVYNRGFSSGFYLGKPINELTDAYGSKAKEKKIEIGKVIHYYSKIKVAIIKIFTEKYKLKLGNEIAFIGNTTGFFKQRITSMEIDNKKVNEASKGLVAIKVNERVREGDKVYLLLSN